MWCGRGRTPEWMAGHAREDHRANSTIAYQRHGPSFEVVNKAYRQHSSPLANGKFIDRDRCSSGTSSYFTMRFRRTQFARL
ncbi:hypothetical protein [Burkholderia pseudomallei]|uniref:hypothetical protein n=1 Tax=Burkholderia pseudomallei TaxID=28450 RepID=UPI003984E793